MDDAAAPIHGPAEQNGEPASEGLLSTGRQLASAFSAAAGRALKSPLAVRACEAGRQRLAEFLDALEDPSCCYLLVSPSDRAPETSEAVAVIAFSPQIAYPMIDRLLGGADSDAFLPGRALTNVERRLLRRFAAHAAEALQTVWPGGRRPELQLVEGEFRPGELPFLRAEQEVATLTIALSLGRHVGAMQLCVPEWVAHMNNTAQPHRRHAEGPLELAASLQAVIDPADLVDLAPGDIVITDSATDGEVVVRLAGIPKFAARLCASDGNRAVTITRKLDGAGEAPPA